MHTKTTLFRGAAVGALIAVATSVAAQAADSHHAHKRIVHKKTIHTAASSELTTLRDELHALQARLDAKDQAEAATQAQIQQAQAVATAAQQQVQTAQAQDADATAAIIQSIPTAVAAEIDKVKPKTDGIYVKGVKITPGGFIEAAGIYRQHNLAADISSPFNSIPFAQSRQGHAEEFRETARQSRLSGLAEGQVNPDLKLSMYGEFDFQAAAQTANSNQSNSYNLRIRNLYGTVDWADEGWHILAGQNWSLATMNSKGISPRNEVIPPSIDAQYVAGFVWTRQPQLRVTKDLFNKSLWLAVSAENPQTTFGGSAPAAANVITTINNGSGFFGGDTGTLSTTSTGGAVTAVSGVAPATQSINHIPDLIGKVATEQDVMGRHVHGEVFGMYRSFYEQLGNLKSNNLSAGSVGGGLTAQAIPGWLDVQLSGVTGKGVGRYATAGLPDVAFTPSGKITAIEETAAMFGVTGHPTKDLDIYVFGGEEHDDRPDGGKGSYGAFTAVNTGCDVEASTLTCTGNTRMLSELTAGLWQKMYSGPWGQVRLGLQWSYIDREAFGGVGGAPTAHDNMLFTSFRYYPF
ncbi:hypothetical protein [Caulobacter sp. S45]|uniref:hypothetical protein n=1 Tax=Caulobacter sp. S45 TaxID=1641861 RepID=UPI00131B073A|nr:hypothetical protein [Caulobacter sp. S45]